MGEEGLLVVDEESGGCGIVWYCLRGNEDDRKDGWSRGEVQSCQRKKVKNNNEISLQTTNWQHSAHERI